MAKAPVVHISSKGQVTLPKPIRELLHVGVGDYLRFRPVAGGVLLTKISLESEEFSDAEWNALERLAAQRGRRYKSAKAFLRDLGRL